MADKLIIFDTTLRDGEQSPGASMTSVEKLEVAARAVSPARRRLPASRNSFDISFAYPPCPSAAVSRMVRLVRVKSTMPS